jgi:hypothetical protein
MMAKKKMKQTFISANFPGLIDLAVDDDGDIVFVVKNGEDLRVTNTWEGYSPPEKDSLPFNLPRAGEILKRYQLDDNNLFDDLVTYFRRFSYLPDEIWSILVCKTFLTYIQDHVDIHYLPIILFFAVPVRGKTRTGKAITYVSYRGIHLVSLREASLFRYSQDLKATLFLDIRDLWRKAKRAGVEDILLLRYEKGAKVPRVLYPEKGAFKDTVHYEVYGSTIIATNEPIQEILDTRCIPISMPNKPMDYENPTPEKAQELKERLTAWRARVMGKPLPQVKPVHGLSGRFWDISKSLLQVCELVCPEKVDALKNALLEIANQKMEDVRESIGSDSPHFI